MFQDPQIRQEVSRVQGGASPVTTGCSGGQERRLPPTVPAACPWLGQQPGHPPGTMLASPEPCGKPASLRGGPLGLMFNGLPPWRALQSPWPWAGASLL